MEVDETKLSEKYDLVKLHITGSTQISKATSTILSRVSSQPSNEKHPILALQAKARYANKLISVVEIAKRELVNGDAECFQYTALSSETIEIPRNPSKRTNNGQHGAKGDDDESDDAFEMMGARSVDGTKTRVVPIMTIFLSDTSVKELKAAYGEQR